MNTIMAPLTPLLNSAVIVVRISGDSLDSVLNFFNFKKTLEHRKTVLAAFNSKSTSISDQVLVTYFKAPNSYTGEEVLEISFHGNPLIVKTAIKDFESVGVRYAERGEFTRRALAQGKITVTQAEAVEALTNAPAAQGLSLALEALEGKLDEKLQSFGKGLLELLAFVEAEIDFSEELGKDELGNIHKKREELLNEVNKLLADYEEARLSLFGAKVVIAGPVNSGKSTLYNALLGEEVAIVTPEAGTTRDINKSTLQLERAITITLVDTAGIRNTESLAEREGIKRAQKAVENADLLLELITLEERCAFEHKNKITLLSKKDLYRALEIKEVDLYVSAKTGEGLKELSTLINERLSGESAAIGLISERQRAVCERCRDFLEQSKNTASLDLSAYEIKNALSCLNELVGLDITEETLSVIFSRFCIGK